MGRPRKAVLTLCPSSSAAVLALITLFVDTPCLSLLTPPAEKLFLIQLSLSLLHQSVLSFVIFPLQGAEICLGVIIPYLSLKPELSALPIERANIPQFNKYLHFFLSED